MGSRGDYLPLRVQGRALLQWRAFTQADLRSKSAQRAQICAPQGHSLGGRSPTFNVEVLKPIGRHCTLAQKSAPMCNACVN